MPATPAPGRVLAIVASAQALTIASASVVAVALPAIGQGLDADGSQQQWVIDAFVLVFAALLVAGGVLGDRRGRRTAFVAGLALFGFGSLLCALAPSIEWLLAGRVITALGPPLILPASLALVTAAYAEPAARARAIGLWGAGSGLGLAAGPVLGGVLVDAFSWHAVFAFNVPLSVLFALTALRFVPRDRPAAPAHGFDGIGALLLTVGIAALVFAVIEGRGFGWGSTVVVGAFVTAALALAAFVAWEHRHPAPLVELGLLRQPLFVAANVGGMTMFFALLGAAVFFSLFLQQIQGRSAIETGACLLPEGLGIVLAAPIAGRVTARIGPRVPILVGVGLVIAALLVLLRVQTDSPASDVWWAFGLLGLGAGLALPPMTVVALAAAPPAQTGMASAVHQASRQLGQTLGVAVLGAVIFAHAGPGAEDARRLVGPAAEGWVDGLHVALLVCVAALVATAALVARLVPAGRPA